jgi:hypothetical protein
MDRENTLPDLFVFKDGRKVANVADWRRRREELLEDILDIEYGHLPPAPESVEGELLNSHGVKRFGDARHDQYRLRIAGREFRYQFMLDLMIPKAKGPFPVVINGDGCWKYVTDEVTSEVLRRGYVLAQFNRTEVVPDAGSLGRTTGLYDACPGGDYGALAAWAWGYHRCIDFLVKKDCIDKARIAAVGHSRGGKAVLLAGATDERIALTAPNGSGCGGGGCFRIQQEGSEKLSDILKNFPYWFSPRLKEYVGREDELPFDQHSLKALVAPRALICTEANGDLWANPEGTRQSHLAALGAYGFLAAGENGAKTSTATSQADVGTPAGGRLGIHFRDGEHSHSIEDWKAFLDFADFHFGHM